ncbi:MAG: S8 family peptidase [Flavobacteriaceae bacterium]|jgi:hypothetical protein|nr:S8 family peptidase [Flavobacteriaceae bacterium]
MKKFLFSISFIIGFGFFQAQNTELVFVHFKDKPNKAAFYANPLSELSQKSLDRRSNLGIPLNDQDAPIEPTYIQNIQNLGFTVADSSKWLNGVIVNATEAQIDILEDQSFVDSVESFVVHPGIPFAPENHKNKWENFENMLLTEFDYGIGAAQIDQINLRQLHQAGFTGTGISIAVIDTGFPTVDTGSAFSRLWTNNLIKGGYNFVSKNTDIYNLSLNSHGTIVLGVIGGFLNGDFAGAAPDADFYLYATETTAQEIPEEQIYWIEAAEEADRKGVDVITTSLGYSTFDDSRYDLTYDDMNGSVSFIARGAQIAAEKGIFVLSAAGNSGQDSWHYIISPADNAKVFTIGAVDSAGNSSSFSSFGPNSAGVVKPDGSTRGTNTATVFDDFTTFASGTSLATPLAAGGVACLLQALPNTMSRENIKNLLKNTASLAPNHDDQMGYGILNFGKAYNDFLAVNENPASENFKIYPNPNNGNFSVESSGEGNIKILDMSGKLIYTGKLIKGKTDISLKLPPGNYLAISEIGRTKVSEKLIIR